MWQTKYASVVPKNLGVNFRPCSEDYILSGHCSPCVEQWTSVETQAIAFLTLFGGDTFIPWLVLFGSNFVSRIFIKNFQAFSNVKIDINRVILTPCPAH